MTSYSYKNGILGAQTAAGWQSLLDVVGSRSHAVYIYNAAAFQSRIDALKKSLTGINSRAHYAMKANANIELLNIVKKNGLGVDVVSLGEAKWAMEHGFQGSDIIFSGVGKSKEELTFAVQNNIAQINVESLPELKRLGEICKSLKAKASVGLRLNPDIKVDSGIL